MRIKEIVEAAMSVGIQGRKPVSAGARGLMAARWKYDTIVDAASNNNMQGAIDRLANNLDSIEQINYDSIDQLMQNIGQTFQVDTGNLHDAFVKKYHTTPDNFAKKLKRDRANRPKSV